MISLWNVCILILALFGTIFAAPVSITDDDIIAGEKTIFSRENVPMLHIKNKRSLLDDISNAKIDLIKIENLDIQNGMLRDLMIKPINNKR